MTRHRGVPAVLALGAAACVDDSIPVRVQPPRRVDFPAAGEDAAIV